MRDEASSRLTARSVRYAIVPSTLMESFSSSDPTIRVRMCYGVPLMCDVLVIPRYFSNRLLKVADDLSSTGVEATAGFPLDA